MIKKKHFCLFGHFSDSTSINDSLTTELNYLLNWIIFWIESPEFILNWILNNQYWIESFFDKLKHWIESDRVSPTLTKWTQSIKSKNKFFLTLSLHACLLFFGLLGLSTCFAKIAICQNCNLQTEGVLSSCVEWGLLAPVACELSTRVLLIISTYRVIFLTGLNWHCL